MPSIRNAEADEMELFIANDTIDYSDCADRIVRECGDEVGCSKHDTEIRIQSNQRIGIVAAYAVCIESGAFECYCKVLKVRVPFLTAQRITRYSEVSAAIHYLRSYDTADSKVDFCQRQIELLSDRRYDADDFAVAFQLRAVQRATICCAAIWFCPAYHCYGEPLSRSTTLKVMCTWQVFSEP